MVMMSSPCALSLWGQGLCKDTKKKIAVKDTVRE